MLARLTRPTFYIEAVLPPAILAYFAWAWRICTGPVTRYIAVGLGYPRIGALYSTTARLIIGTVSTLFLRLYFLPPAFAAPPPHPPPSIAARTVIFEVPAQEVARLIPHRGGSDAYTDAGAGAAGDGASKPAPRDVREGSEDADDDGLVPRCNKDKCGMIPGLPNGRWKPPRARHCSECGRCRVGFDHHCYFLANCISAPSLPAFTSLLLLAPPFILLLAFPVLSPSLAAARAAWAAAATNPRVQAYWGKWWSWVLPAGPVARYVVGLLVVWADVPPTPGPPGDAGAEAVARMGRVDVGILLGVGGLLALITAGLGTWQLFQISRGELGIDVMRSRSYAKACEAVREAEAQAAKQASSQPDRDSGGSACDQDTPLARARAAKRRFSPTRWFFVPLQHETYAGAVLPALPHELPYDLGAKANFDVMVGRGRWGWMLPWCAIRRGMRNEEASVWPINEGVRRRLEGEAARLLEEVERVDE